MEGIPVLVGLDEESAATYRRQAALYGMSLQDWLSWFLKETVSRTKEFDALRNGPYLLDTPGGNQ